MRIACNGPVNENYNIGGNNEEKNIDFVRLICTILDSKIKNKPNNISSFADLICYVDDRPGHEQRYAIYASKLEKDLNWRPEETFSSGLEKTVEWYLKMIGGGNHSLKVVRIFNEGYCISWRIGN